MLADRLKEVCRLRAFHHATPADIAQKLGISVTAVEKIFEMPEFGDLVEANEELLILHLISKLPFLDIPYQRSRYLFSTGGHQQKISLARSLLLNLPPHERYPDTVEPAESA